jgi:hypothetical protein
MAGKQIDFPPIQKEDPKVAPFMIGLSLVCIVIVVVILLTDKTGGFIGPWG